MTRVRGLAGPDLRVVALMLTAFVAVALLGCTGPAVAANPGHHEPSSSSRTVAAEPHGDHDQHVGCPAKQRSTPAPLARADQRDHVMTILPALGGRAGSAETAAVPSERPHAAHAGARTGRHLLLQTAVLRT